MRIVISQMIEALLGVRLGWHTRRLPLKRWSDPPDLFQNTLGHQAGRDQQHRQAGAGVSAAAYKVQVATAAMPVLGSQIARLGKVVAEGGPLWPIIS